MDDDPGIKRVAVIGAGTIGASWAACFLSRDLEVKVFDPAPAAESGLRRFIAAAWPALLRSGAMQGTKPDAFVFERDVAAAVAGADFVQESGPEREDLKVDLFRQLDAALPSDVIIASSSSGLLMSRLQQACRHPQRFVIGHPFNPPHIIPLVEVVGGNQTSADTISRAMAFYRSVGKEPIHIRKEMKGHVANRLQAALWREAVHLVATGVVSVEDVDKAVTMGPGLRWAIMGPNMTFHLGGGDGGIEHFMSHLGGAFEDWWDDLGSPRLTSEIQQTIVAGVNQAAAGRSVGELRDERDRMLLDILERVRPAG